MKEALGKNKRIVIYLKQKCKFPWNWIILLNPASLFWKIENALWVCINDQFESSLSSLGCAWVDNKQQSSEDGGKHVGG